MSDHEQEGLSGSGLSIIPYDNNRDVVLRHADSVVYLDPRTNAPVLFRDRGQDLERRSSSNDNCPTCHRPWHATNGNGGANGPPTTVDEPTFITRDYFQRLALSLPGSAQPSAPPSPRRRLAQPVTGGKPVRSRFASPVGDRTATPPPVNAEFVGSSPAPPSAANGISESAFAPQYFQKFFKVERELGRGGRGVVLLVQHVLDGVHLGHFACKRVPIGDDHSWLEKVLVEVQLLTQLSHQNLVSYRHVWLEDFKINAFSPTVPCAFILQQYCNGGDLHNYICSSAHATTSTQQLKERIRRRSRGEVESPPSKTNEPKKLHTDEIYSFFRDITAGLRFLHHNGFIHRDLKPSNCLLHTVADETRVLVSDFGEVQYENASRKSTGATGTISYCAPEVLKRVSPTGPFGNFTFKSDIFSLGMILHFLCFADLPYASADVLFEDREDVDKLRTEISGWSGFDDRKRQRRDLPGELYPFLKRLLSVDPQYRPTAEEVNRGISTGRLSDLMPELSRRRGSAGSGPVEELTPGKRIQKLDTPKEGNSPSRSSQESRLGPGLLLGRRPLRSRSRERSNPNSHLAVETAIDDDGDDDDDYYDNDDDDEEYHEGTWAQVPLDASHRGPYHDEQRNGKASLDSTIVLRPRQRQAAVASTPASPSVERPQMNLPSPTAERKAQLLLPPAPIPRIQSLSQRMTTLLQTPITSPLVRACILLAKVSSILHPCLSGSKTGGINSWVVYPLIAVAVAELARTSPLRLQHSLAFAAFHIVLLSLAWRKNLLCTATVPSWSWDHAETVEDIWEAPSMDLG